MALPAPTPVPAQDTAPVPVPDESPVRMTDGVRGALEQLETTTDALKNSPFVPIADHLADVEKSLREVHAAVTKARADAADAKRTATEERARLTEELQPVVIERTEATKELYKRCKGALTGRGGLLYKCPLSDENGVCALGNSSRPFNPSVQKTVRLHINRWHIGMHDPTYTPRETNGAKESFWDNGEKARAKAFTMGERVQVTKAGDSRTEQYGHVVRNVMGGAMVRFDDNSVEGFRHSSIKAAPAK